MKLNRRDLLKMSVLGGAALALPLERTLGEPPLANRIAESTLPAPFTIPFTVPPVIKPGPDRRDDRLLQGLHEAGQADVFPGFKTPLWGYNGAVPGPDRSR